MDFCSLQKRHVVRPLCILHHGVDVPAWRWRTPLQIPRGRDHVETSTRHDDMTTLLEACGRVEERPMAYTQGFHRILAGEADASTRRQFFNIGRQGGGALRYHISKSALPAEFLI